MSPARRSEMLAMLLKQQQDAANFRGNKTGVEAALRMATKWMNKKRIDKLEDAKAADQVLLNKEIAKALPKNALVDKVEESSGTVGEAIIGDEGDPLMITKKGRSTEVGKRPGSINDALAGVMALDPGLQQQGIASIGKIQDMQPKAAPKAYQTGTGSFEAKVDITDSEGNVVVPKDGTFEATTRFDPATGVKTRYVTSENGEEVPVLGGQIRKARTVTEDATDLTRGAASKIATDLAQLKGDMDKTAKLMEYNPEEFLTYVGRGKKFLGDIADKMGLAGEERKAWLERAQDFQGTTYQVFTGIRREVTGAQAAKIELDVLEQAFLSNKMGPSQYRAALVLIGEMQQAIFEAKSSLINKGITKESNPELYEMAMDGLIDKYKGRSQEIVSATDDKDVVTTDSGATITFEDD